jgi:hypothetical protein
MGAIGPQRVRLQLQRVRLQLQRVRVEAPWMWLEAQPVRLKGADHGR